MDSLKSGFNTSGTIAYKTSPITTLANTTIPTANVTTITTTENSEYNACAICLMQYVQPAQLSSCPHIFCLACIQRWADIVRQCPLCKMHFNSLLYKVVENVYRVHTLDSYRDRPTRVQDRAHYRYRRSHRLITDRPTSQPSPSPDVLLQQSIKRRRLIYLHKATPHLITTNELPNFREVKAVCSPELFKRTPARLDRLIPWIKRDLQVLDPLVPLTSSSTSANTDTIDFIQQYVLGILKEYDPQSNVAIQLLSTLLQEYAERFLQELISFATSPFNINTYDHTINYQSIPSLSEMLSNADNTTT